MERTSNARLSRRTALLGGAGAATAALATAFTHAPVLAAARAIQSGGGIAGGGTITVNHETKIRANFSLIASRFSVVDEEDPIFIANVTWQDSAGFGFTSNLVTFYGRVDGDVDTARLVEGSATLTSGVQHPFSLYLNDLGQPGEKKDQLKLTIGPAGNPIYQVDGTLSSGDLLLIKFNFDEAEVPTNASPVPTASS